MERVVSGTRDLEAEAAFLVGHVDPTRVAAAHFHEVHVGHGIRGHRPPPVHFRFAPATGRREDGGGHANDSSCLDQFPDLPFRFAGKSVARETAGRRRCAGPGRRKVERAGNDIARFARPVRGGSREFGPAMLFGGCDRNRRRSRRRRPASRRRGRPAAQCCHTCFVCF